MKNPKISDMFSTMTYRYIRPAYHSQYSEDGDYSVDHIFQMAKTMD
jgi:hypothetical protein